MRLKLILALGFCHLGLIQSSYAVESDHQFKYPVYAGLIGGYGWTTWQGLVPSDENQNIAMVMSTPKFVNESGAVWGLFMGYEFIPYFALEALYMHYPSAQVNFDEESIFTFEHEGTTKFTTHTEVVSLMGKIMMFIPYTNVRAYSSFGVAALHRDDRINDDWILSPSFGVGLNYNFNQHIMGEFGAFYAAGRGEAELNPVDDYFPFIYSVFFRLAYRF